MDWAWREGSAEALDWRVVVSWAVRVEEMADRRASFSGLGGTGGTGRLLADVAAGNGMSKGDVSRSTGGLAAGFG